MNRPSFESHTASAAQPANPMGDTLGLAVNRLQGCHQVLGEIETKLNGPRIEAVSDEKSPHIPSISENAQALSHGLERLLDRLSNISAGL